MSTDVIRATPAALLAATRGSLTDLLKPAATGAYRDLRRPKSRTAARAVPRTTFDPTLPDSIANPYPALARIREHPVVVNEDLGVWMLGRYDDVHAAARDSATFSSTDGILLRSFGASAVVFAQPPDHTRLRRVAAPIFNKRAVGDLTSEIRQLASAGIAPLRTGEVVDLVQSLTIPMPINVIAQMLGIPRGNWADFRSMSEHFAGIFGPRTTAEIVRVIGTGLPAYVRFRTLIGAEMTKRTNEPADDLLTRLQIARAAGELSETEAFVYAFLLLVAGNETTTNLLGMLLLRMAEDPDLFAELKSDRSLIPAAVEETARWGSPVQWVGRTLTTAHRIGDTVSRVVRGRCSSIPRPIAIRRSSPIRTSSIFTVMGPATWPSAMDFTSASVPIWRGWKSRPPLKNSWNRSTEWNWPDPSGGQPPRRCRDRPRYR